MSVIPDLRILVKETWNSSKYIEILDLYLWRRKWQPTLVFLPGESQGNLTGSPEKNLGFQGFIGAWN